MPYDSDTGLYERRSTTVIDASPDGDTVYIAIDAKLDLAADDTVVDLNHHAANGNHYPATSTADDSRFLRQSPSGTVSWANGVVAADAALKDMSNVASGAIAPAKVAQDANNRFMTDTERTKLEGIETGAQVHIAPSKAEVEAVLTGSISTHTHADASTSAKGLIEIATEGETTGLSDPGRAIVPANLLAGAKAALNAGGSAPVYACRAWVNFDGVNITTDYGNGANGIRGFGNVSSVVRNSTGIFTMNFITPMQDADYSIVSGGSIAEGANATQFPTILRARTVGSFEINTWASPPGGVFANHINCYVSIFR
jgi:hypothetical protein